MTRHLWLRNGYHLAVIHGARQAERMHGKTKMQERPQEWRVVGKSRSSGVLIADAIRIPPLRSLARRRWVRQRLRQSRIVAIEGWI